MKDQRFNCYPFMNEDNWATDFEVLTDGLSSEVAFAASFNKGDIKTDLEEIIKYVLDVNPMIRKYNQKIVDETKSYFNSLYEKYDKKFTTFYIPVGDTASTSISRLRMHSKHIIRLINRNDKSQKDLLDIFNILTNIFHLMWLNTTDRKEPYASKTY